MNSFHISFEITNYRESLNFYTNVLGGRIELDETTWCNINLFGHQVTFHHEPEMQSIDYGNFHWGLNIPIKRFEALYQKLKDANTEFVIYPEMKDNHAGNNRLIMKIKDPNGFVLEFKTFRNIP